MSTLKRSILFLVRHGECRGNVEQKTFSSGDILTDKGNLQANLLGELIREEKFTDVYASPFVRTLETAKGILSKSTALSNLNIPIQEDARLREKHLGLLEGKSFREILGIIQNSGKDWLEYEGHEVEKYADVEARVASFFQDLFEKIDSSDEPLTILSVTHAGILLHVWRYLRHDSKRFVLKNWKPEYYKVTPNTGYFKLNIEKSPMPGKPREIEILVAHGKEHLKGLEEDAMHKATQESEYTKKFQTCVHQ